jgi:hypothetical protein
MKFLIVIFLFLLAIPTANAQTPVVTKPYKAYTYNYSGTIAVTNTFQTVFVVSSADTGRVACTIANYGTNKMYVFFGPIANATLTNSIQLAANQSISCNIGGVVLQDQVSITGTSGDAFYAAQQ